MLTDYYIFSEKSFRSQPSTTHHKFIWLFITAPIKEQAFELSDILAARGTRFRPKSSINIGHLFIHY
jgi:hypothetical protein